MTDNRKSRGGNLGYMIPVLLFVLFFALCSVVLAGVFVRSENISESAKAYNDCVQLCRNEAERFRAGEELEKEKSYDAELCPTGEIQGEYLVYTEVSNEPTPAGRLETALIRAEASSGAAEYELQVVRYCPEER